MKEFVNKEIFEKGIRQENKISKKNLFSLLTLITKELQEKYQITNQEIIEKINRSSNEFFISLSIFSSKLSPSEALNKFLKENFQLRYSEIAAIINRDERSVWNSYNRAKNKDPKKLPIRGDLFIPSSIFKNRNLSIQENIVLYLKINYNFTFNKIAELLDKDLSTILTSYYRAKQKMEKNEKTT